MRIQYSYSSGRPKPLTDSFLLLSLSSVVLLLFMSSTDAYNVDVIQKTFRNTRYRRDIHEVPMLTTNFRNDFKGSSPTDREIIENLLRRYRFPESSANVSVAVHITVNKIFSANDEECKLMVSLQQKWIDPRLSFETDRPEHSSVRLRSSAYIWNPSLFVVNAIHSTPIGREEIHVFNSGLVDHIQKLEVILDDVPNLRSYPFEAKNCTLILSNDDSRASWTRITSATVLQLSYGVWKVIGLERDRKTFTIELTRSIEIWILTLFVPSILLLAISWISFWMSTKSQLPRIFLTFSVFFTLSIMVLCKSWTVPRTPYFKALDIWNILVLSFGLLPFVESCLVTSCAMRQTITRQRIVSGEEAEEKTRWINETPYYVQLPERKPRTAAKLCDYIFRFVYPFLFLSMCSAYFIFYSPALL